MVAEILLTSTSEKKYFARVSNVLVHNSDLPSWVHLVDVQVQYLWGARGDRYWSDPTDAEDRWIPREQIKELIVK